MENVLDQKLYSYFTQLNEAEKKSVLLMLKNFLAGRTKVNDPVSIEEYNREIDEALEEALEEASSGNYITQEDMEKKASKW